LIIQKKREGGYLYYKSNPRLTAVSLGISTLTFFVYMFYFDILVPFIPQGSVRYSYGSILFAIPVFLLLGAQSLFTTYLLHLTTKVIDEQKRDLNKAYFVSSLAIFLFSICYVFHPYYGPYSFIVYFTPAGQNFPAYTIPLFSAWFAVMIGIIAYAIRATFDLEDHPQVGIKRILILSATMFAVILAMAS
jgi:hypothetical protein